MRKISRSLIAVCAVVAALALLLPAGVSSAPSSLVAVAAMWSAPGNFNPVNADSQYGWYCIRLMFSTLLEARLTNNRMEFLPELASRWTVGADRQTFTFTINARATWHDGQPVTADDVDFTVRTIADPRTKTNRGSDIASIAGLDAKSKMAPGGTLGLRVLGPKTFEVKTRTPIDPNKFLELFGANVYIIPKHVLGSVPPDQLDRQAFVQRPTVGSGPYKFVQYRTDEYLELAANNDFYLGAPRIQRVFVRIIPPAAMLAGLERGEVDFTAGFNIGEVDVTDWDRVKSLTQVRAASFPAPGYQYMVINWKQPFFQDKRVRQALAEAINRPLMVNQLFRGEAVLADSPIAPSSPYFDKQIKPWPYDPGRARALLQEAGWDANRTLLLRVPTGNVPRERSADIIQQNLMAVGVKTQIQKSDFPTLISDLYAGKYDLSLVGFTAPSDPDVSSQYRTGGQYNFSFHSIAQMDQLLDTGAATPDPTKRRGIYDQFQQLFADQLPVIILYYPNARTAVGKRMANVVTDAQGLYDFAPYRWTAGSQ